jgi:hypothetical protein
MKIKCIINKIDNTLAKVLEKDPSQIFLTVGKEYTVYVIVQWNIGDLRYGITDDIELPYPHFYPPSLFKVTDKRLSKYWIYDYEQELQQPRFAFKEWIEEPYFWDSLTDGNNREVEIYKKYQSLMDSEFSNN